jgi:hypothetical protein
MYWQIECGASGDWGVKRITVSSEQIAGGEEGPDLGLGESFNGQGEEGT